MKILRLSHFLPYPSNGGALQRIRNLLRQIAGRHEVHLVSLNQGKNLPTRMAIVEATGFLKGICKRIDVFPIPSDAAKWRWVTMTMASNFLSPSCDVNWLMNRDVKKFLERLSKTETFDLVRVDTIGLHLYVAPFSRMT